MGQVELGGILTNLGNPSKSVEKAPKGGKTKISAVILQEQGHGEGTEAALLHCTWTRQAGVESRSHCHWAVVIMVW